MNILLVFVETRTPSAAAETGATACAVSAAGAHARAGSRGYRAQGQEGEEEPQG